MVILFPSKIAKNGTAKTPRVGREKTGNQDEVTFDSESPSSASAILASWRFHSSDFQEICIHPPIHHGPRRKSVEKGRKSFEIAADDAVTLG